MASERVPPRAFAALVLTVLLAATCTSSIHAAERHPDASTMHTLVALGCSTVPEEGPRAMNCTSDSGYFLCAVFEKLGKPLECSVSSTPAIRDTALMSDDHFLHTELPRIAAKTPCAVWAYPEDDAFKLGASRRCALQVLRTLHCQTATGDSGSGAMRSKIFATCPKPQRRVCASLQEAGLIERCSP